MNGIHIDRCRFRDLPAVYRVHCESFPFQYGFLRFLYFRCRSPRTFLVARRQGQVVGYLIAGRAWTWPFQRIGEIVSVAITPAHRRNGIGSALLGHVLRELEGLHVHKVYLQVAVSNVGAQQLYAKFNFVIEKRLPHYYSDGEDAFLMVRRIRTATAPSIPTDLPAATTPQCLQWGSPALSENNGANSSRSDSRTCSAE